MSFFRKEGYHLSSDDFISIAATAGDSLIPPEYMDPLLRCIKGFPSSSDSRPIIADSHTTIWHLGVILLQVYIGRSAFCSLPLYKKMMEAIDCEERGSNILAASTQDKARQREGFKIFLEGLKVYMDINKIDGRKPFEVQQNSIL